MPRGTNTTRELARDIRTEHKRMLIFTFWMTIGDHYEFEYNARGYTGWYRGVGGRMADGRFPERNINTGATRG